MLRDLISKGKEIADKVTNIVMNFTEVEAKVREATSDEAWGPHGRLMNELAEYTYCHSTYLEVMGTLWKRLHTENMRNWRRVYKVSAQVVRTER
ncbi:Clint1 protein [Fasciola gigantica]|uniref:Clint1 protein n=1 Tax=Fasciola gigantica TaxID=46835 RepID=A0A504Y4C5_FASGI|nr:Clint1 protein [Fasciola gigantica]